MKKREIPTVREIRLATPLGRNEFAARLGVSEDTLKQIEAGRQRMTPSFVRRLAKVYGVQPKSVGTGPATDCDGGLYDRNSFRRWQARTEFSEERLLATNKVVMGLLEEFLATAAGKSRGAAALLLVAEFVEALASKFGRPFASSFQNRLRAPVPGTVNGPNAAKVRARFESISEARANFRTKLEQAIQDQVRPATHAGPGSHSASKRIIAVARALHRKQRRRTPAKVIQPVLREIRTLRDGSIVELYAPPIDLRGVISIGRAAK